MGRVLNHSIKRMVSDLVEIAVEIIPSVAEARPFTEINKKQKLHMEEYRVRIKRILSAGAGRLLEMLEGQLSGLFNAANIR